MRGIDFSGSAGRNVSIQYQYVKRNLNELGFEDSVFGFEERAHKVIERFMQGEIDAEFDLQIRAGRYEHADERLDTRKGRYERHLMTTFGTGLLMVPRSRGKVKVQFSLFRRYQRRRSSFDECILLSMLLGLSVRKQRRFFERFIGDAVSHTTASQLINNLQKDLDRFRTEPIEDIYKYLIIDGLWIKVMGNDKRLRKRVILFVMGITMDNKKKLIGFKLAYGETEEETTSILNDLYRRGLKGRNLRLIVSDDSEGIKAGIRMVYPYVVWQLCSTHKLRNLSSNIQHKKKHRKEMMEGASDIYQASTRKQAEERFDIFRKKWEILEPKAIKCFMEGFDNTLAYYTYDNDRNFISTTNHIERELEEIRRRIKIQGYFKSEKNLDLWIYGIISLSNEKQKKQFEKLKVPEGVPNYAIALVKEPIKKCAQLS